MKLKDKKAWDTLVNKNRDPYGSTAIRYAERWADLMEKRMAEGARLEDIAKETSNKADTEWISVFIYGCAVSILAKVWKHGEALRRWHNISVQIRDEGERANESGGVLNPALVTIGPPREGDE